MPAMRILLAEDDLVLRRVMHEALVDDGHAVTSIANPIELPGAYPDEPWDLFVTDVGGASFAGPDDSTRARLRQVAARGPVVLVTGRAWAHTMDPCELGVRAIVLKPFDLSDLLAAVDQVAESE